MIKIALGQCFTHLWFPYQISDSPGKGEAGGRRVPGEREYFLKPHTVPLQDVCCSDKPGAAAGGSELLVENCVSSE